MNANEVPGILSNWDKIEAMLRVGIHDNPGEAKDVQDIIDLIHELQETAHTVSPLRELFTKHLTNNTNPHDVAISISDIDMMNFLYQTYIVKYGAIITLSEFTVSMIDLKRFATRADIDAGTNLTSAMNVDTMDYLVDLHDSSSAAHADLFRLKLPGIPITEPPSFVFEPTIPATSRLTVERNCSMNYHDMNGRVKTVGVDKLPIDYSFGVPAAPIFGDRRNILLNSRNLSGVTIHGGIRVANPSLLILTPSDDQNYLLFTEEEDFGTHGFTDLLPEELTKTCGYTVYAFPLDRSSISIDLVDLNEVIICSAKYNFNSGESEVSPSLLSKAFSELNILPNGWVRCHLGFDAHGQNLRKIKVNVLKQNTPDVYGDEEYAGTLCNAMVFWQHQLTEGILPVPPIFTDNAPVTVLATKVSRPFDDRFNPVKGTFHIKYISSLTERFGGVNSLFRLGDIVSDDPKTIVAAETNPIDSTRNRITSYNENDDVLAMIDSHQYDSENPCLVKRVEFTYLPGYHGYGFTNSRPHLFHHYDEFFGGARVVNYDEAIISMNDFFTEIYDQLSGQIRPTIIQSATLLDDPIDLIGPTISSAKDNLPQYRIGSEALVLELGYNSVTGQSMDGYLLNFRYYPVASTKMNLEFLLDQYIPET